MSVYVWMTIDSPQQPGAAGVAVLAAGGLLFTPFVFDLTGMLVQRMAGPKWAAEHWVSPDRSIRPTALWTHLTVLGLLAIAPVVLSS